MENKENLSDLKNPQPPFSIIIKNNTNEKLFDVPVFNKDFKNQEKITYLIPIKDITYNHLLIEFALKKHKIKTTILVCDNEETQTEQLNCDFSISNPDKKDTYQLRLYEFQEQKNIVTSLCKYEILNDGKEIISDMRLQHLMPNTSIILHLYCE